MIFEELNNNGGHIVVGILLIVGGAAMVKWGIAEGHEIIGCGSTIIARSMYDTYRGNTATPRAGEMSGPISEEAADKPTGAGGSVAG